MAAMSCEDHLRELTAPLPVLPSIYTVPYIWRLAHEAARHSARVQAPGASMHLTSRAAKAKRVPVGPGSRAQRKARLPRMRQGSVA